MNEPTKTLIATAFELGLPIVLLVLSAFRPTWRKWIVVVLGALTPLLLSYAVTSARHLIFKDEGAMWAFAGMWITSFIPYVGCAVFGATLGIIRVPQSKSMRYIVGLFPPAALAVAWSVITQLSAQA